MRWALLLALAGCSRVSWLGDTLRDPGSTATSSPSTSSIEPTTPATTDTDCDPDVTWESFAAGTIKTWCTPCHSATVPVTERAGAPLGVDFDRYEDVVLHGPSVAVRVSGDSPSMPPSGGLTEVERAKLADWILCGAPIEQPTTSPPDVCATLVSLEGDATAGLCGSGVNTVTGNVVVSEVGDVTCLCEVGGDLVLDETEAALPHLGAVGGSIVVGELLTALELPELTAVGGDLDAVGASSVVEVLLPELVSIGGDVRVVDAWLIEALELPSLGEVIGSIEVANAPAMVWLELPRLVAVGGDVLISEALALPNIDSMGAVVSIGGDLRAEQVGMGTFNGFIRTESIGGDIVVADNPNLLSFFGFQALVEVGGAIEVARNPILRELISFPDLETLGDSMTIDDNRDLEVFDGFPHLAEIRSDEFGMGRLSVQGSALEAIPEFPELRSMGGILIRDNRRLEAVDGFHKVDWVNGDVKITTNDKLVTVSMLSIADHLEGALVITDLERLVEVTGLSEIGDVGDRMVFEALPKLRALPPFEELETVHLLTIDGCNSLADLAGLSDLEEVRQALKVTDNARLESFGGMTELASVGGALVVTGHASLTSVSDLESIEFVGGGFVMVDNPMVPRADVRQLIREIDLIEGEIVVE
jgi:hypothetical protein